METPSRIETGIEYIRTRGNATGQELADLLNCPRKLVQPMLYLAITTGYLATSKRAGTNLYRISEDVPAGMSWADYKLSKRVPKAKSESVKPPSKAKVMVEKPERTPAEVRNALADIFERRALGLPKAENDVTTSEATPAGAVKSATQGYEVIELEHKPEPAAAIAVPTIPASAQVETAAPIDEVLFLFGHDGRLQVIVGDQRIICTREETAAVGRMMSALEPVWNV